MVNRMFGSSSPFQPHEAKSTTHLQDLATNLSKTYKTLKPTADSGS